MTPIISSHSFSLSTYPERLHAKVSITSKGRRDKINQISLHLFLQDRTNYLKPVATFTSHSFKRCYQSFVTFIFYKATAPSYQCYQTFNYPLFYELAAYFFITPQVDTPFVNSFCRWILTKNKEMFVVQVYSRIIKDSSRNSFKRRLNNRLTACLLSFKTDSPFQLIMQSLALNIKSELVLFLIKTHQNRLIKKISFTQEDEEHKNRYIYLAKQVANHEIIYYYQHKRRVSEHQLNQLAYLCLINKSDYMNYFYIASGGTQERLDKVQKENNLSSNVYLYFKRVPDFYITESYFTHKRKIARRLLKPFVTWVLNYNKTLSVTDKCSDTIRRNLDKWSRRAAKRYSDYLVEISPYISIKSATKELSIKARALVLSDLIRKGRNQIAKELIDLKTDLEVRDLKNNTPLITAAKYNNLEMVEFLLEFGADLEAEGENGSTAVKFSLQGGYEPLSQKLIQEGASLNKKNSSGRTALFYAIESKDLEVIQRILGSPNKKKALTARHIIHISSITQALFFSSFRYSPFTVSLEDTDRKGLSVFDLAKKNPGILNLLLDYSKTRKEAYLHKKALLEKYPQLVQFANLTNLVILNFSLFHRIKIGDKEEEIKGCFKNVSFPDFLESIKEYLPELVGEEKVLWEKTYEICKWGYEHEDKVDELIVKAPFDIIAYAADYLTQDGAHEISLCISKKSSRLIYGDRGSEPSGLQIFEKISLSQLDVVISRSLKYKYRLKERFFKKVTSKLKAYFSNEIIFHKTQKATNCPVIATKSLARSVMIQLLMDNGTSCERAREISLSYHKRWSRFHRLRLIKKFLLMKEEIDRISKREKLSRNDLMELKIVIEPILDKIFMKCLSKGILEGLSMLLPYSSFQKDPNRYFLKAFLQSPKISFPWLVAQSKGSTKLLTLLKDLNPHDKEVNNFLQKNHFLVLNIEKDENLIHLFFLAYREKNRAILPVLKESLSKIEDLTFKVKNFIDNKFSIGKEDTLQQNDQYLREIFEELDHGNPYDNPTF